ncbi:MAG: hypothetical protein N2234_03790, partial [Planctomycetota bacterium]|nr:hypothetical protein [Planctomycetota bacterium]
MEKFLGEEALPIAGLLAGCFVHDLKNRLQVVLANCESFKATEQKRYFENAKKGMLGILRSSEEFLSLIRSKKPKMVLFRLSSLFEELKTFLSPYLRRKGTRLSTRGDASVQMDRSLLRAALMNLIVNAVEAGASKILVGVDVKDDSLILSVDDNGKPLKTTEEGVG